MNLTNREFQFDYGHRVMNHISKCNNYHGHRAKVICQYTYDVDTTGDHIGYAVDFSEIKRVFAGFCDNYLDHGFLMNTNDPVLDLLVLENKKYWIMTLGNPTAENIAKELFYISQKLMDKRNLKTHNIIFYETPNCSVECSSISDKEFNMLEANKVLQNKIQLWDNQIGSIEYDLRKVNKENA